MDGFQRLSLDTLKYLFSKIDISLTVSCIEALYANSGKGRRRYPVRSMLLALLFMRFEAIPPTRKLCRRLERRSYAREICEFSGRSTPKHNTFSLFIKRAGPETIESMFTELRDQAFRMGIIDPEEAVRLCADSTFMKAYSRRGRKGGISDRGARVGKTERRSYRRARAFAKEGSLPSGIAVSTLFTLIGPSSSRDLLNQWSNPLTSAHLYAPYLI